MANVTFTEWNPMAVINMVKNVSRSNLEQASKLLIEKIKDSMNESKSGRRYGFHIASAEGETPAVLTGKLIDALEYVIVEEGGE